MFMITFSVAFERLDYPIWRPWYVGIWLFRIQTSFKCLFKETTANAMIVTLSYLAIYQDEQEKAYTDVKSRLSADGELVISILF